MNCQVVRLSYRQLTVEEERLEGQVMQQWELFLSQMQIASEFINTHTPIMMKSLEESHAVSVVFSCIYLVIY